MTLALSLPAVAADSARIVVLDWPSVDREADPSRVEAVARAKLGELGEVAFAADWETWRQPGLRDDLDLAAAPWLGSCEVPEAGFRDGGLLDTPAERAAVFAGLAACAPTSVAHAAAAAALALGDDALLAGLPDDVRRPIAAAAPPEVQSVVLQLSGDPLPESLAGRRVWVDGREVDPAAERLVAPVPADLRIERGDGTALVARLAPRAPHVPGTLGVLEERLAALEAAVAQERAAHGLPPAVFPLERARREAGIDLVYALTEHPLERRPPVPGARVEDLLAYAAAIPEDRLLVAVPLGGRERRTRFWEVTPDGLVLAAE